MGEAVLRIDPDVAALDGTLPIDQDTAHAAGCCIGSIATEVVLNDGIDRFTAGENDFGLGIFEMNMALGEDMIIASHLECGSTVKGGGTVGQPLCVECGTVFQVQCLGTVCQVDAETDRDLHILPHALEIESVRACLEVGAAVLEGGGGGQSEKSCLTCHIQ